MDTDSVCVPARAWLRWMDGATVLWHNTVAQEAFVAEDYLVIPEGSDRNMIDLAYFDSNKRAEPSQDG